MRRIIEPDSYRLDVVWTAVGISLITVVAVLLRSSGAVGIEAWTSRHWILLLSMLVIGLICTLTTRSSFSVVLQAYLVAALFFIGIDDLRTELLLIAMIVISAVAIYVMKERIVDLLRERQAQEHQLRDALEQLKKVDELKDEVISVASHDLRTPLSIIKLNLATIREGYAGKVNKEALSYVDAAYRASERLGDTLEDLLEASLVEQSENLEFKPVQLEEVIINVVKSHKDMLKHLKVRLPEKPYVSKVYADKSMVRRIIENLLLNSAKYTPRGEIVIVVEEHGPMVRCRISDTGIGIAPEAQQRLFTKFYRAPNALNVETRGSGLGLYITKQAVQRIKGTIHVHSELNKGSTFTFELPKVQA